MFKRKYIRKIVITSAVLFSYFLVSFFSRDEIQITQSLEYKTEEEKHVIYLLDQHQMVSRTYVALENSKDTLTMCKKMLELLILEGESEIKLPSGFKGIIPSDTQILSISFQDGTVKVDFSKEIFNVEESLEEKMISAIVYTLTEIDGVSNVVLYVEGELLTKLPKSRVHLPSSLDKSFGINKEYVFSNYQDIVPVTIYYISKYNDAYYYVPVTKYVNDDREKIKIIVEELSSSSNLSTNLMSFLNSNTELLATLEEMDKLFLTFNEYIFSDMDTKNILEEVIYSISLSVRENYDVEEVIFEVGDNEIYKSVLKTLE